MKSEISEAAMLVRFVRSLQPSRPKSAKREESPSFGSFEREKEKVLKECDNGWLLRSAWDCIAGRSNDSDHGNFVSTKLVRYQEIVKCCNF